MLTEIAGGFASLKAAKDILAAFNGVQTAIAVQEVKFTLGGHLLDAQQALSTAQDAVSTLTSSIGELEAEIAHLKDWEADKERYELADAGQGTLAYRVKAGMETGEPTHWLCPRCFGDTKKSILQPETQFPGRYKVLICNPCKTDFVIHGARPGGGR